MVVFPKFADDMSMPTAKPQTPIRSERVSDVEGRFRTLVQSPLRAGILRFLCARIDESFDVESLMTTFGRLRLDIDNCLVELIDFGLIDRAPDDPSRYRVVQDVDDDRRRLLDTFLERRATVSTEDQAPSVQRFREMIGRDEKMLIVFEWIRTAAKSDISVLILGPTGSGKEVVARMIHELSRRGRENFQPRFPTRCSSRRFLVTRRARSLGRTIASPAEWNWPTMAPCSSTKSAICHSWHRPSCCGCSKTAGSSAWAARSRSTSISA
jgi:hypothetical protein